MKAQHKLVATAVVAVAALVLSACGSSSGGQGTSGGQTSSSSSEQPGPSGSGAQTGSGGDQTTASGTESAGGTESSAGDTSSAPSGNPDAVFTFGQTTGITQLDPNVSSQLAENIYFSLLYNGLTSRDENGKAVPDLAESWETSSDGLTWTFKLHSGVTYASGKAFTASDAVDNINRVLDPKTASQSATNINMITKAVATDPTTLTLTLKSPNAQLPSSLSYVKMTNVADIANVNKNADGTGPYKLKDFVPGQSIDMVARPDYWGGAPKMAEIKLVTYSDETAAETALRNGTLTAFWNPASTAIASLSTGGRQVIESPNPGGIDVLELDTTSAPFDNPVARQALAYAIDRDSIVKAAYAGRAIANPYQTFVSPSSSFFDSSLPSYAYNPDKAKQLFAQAGVTQLTYWTIAGAYPEMAVWGQIIQEDLGKIGIKVDIQAKETSTWVDKFYPNGKKYPGLIVSNKLSFNPAPDVFAPQWFSSTGTCECNWKPPAEYDSAVTALQQATDEAGQKEALTTIQKILNQESPVIVISNSAPVTVVQAGVSGAWQTPDGVLHLEDASMS